MISHPNSQSFIFFSCFCLPINFLVFIQVMLNFHVHEGCYVSNFLEAINVWIELYLNELKCNEFTCEIMILPYTCCKVFKWFKQKKKALLSMEREYSQKITVTFLTTIILTSLPLKTIRNLSA